MEDILLISGNQLVIRRQIQTMSVFASLFMYFCFLSVSLSLEMGEYMKEVVKAHKQLSQEERNLFSVAFKNVVGSRRSAWRIVSSQESKGNPDYGSPERVREYRKKVSIAPFFFN